MTQHRPDTLPFLSACDRDAGFVWVRFRLGLVNSHNEGRQNQTQTFLGPMVSELGQRNNLGLESPGSQSLLDGGGKGYVRRMYLGGVLKVE